MYTAHNGIIKDKHVGTAAFAYPTIIKCCCCTAAIDTVIVKVTSHIKYYIIIVVRKEALVRLLRE